MTWRGVRTVMVLELRQRVRTSRRHIGLATVGLPRSGQLRLCALYLAQPDFIAIVD